MRFVHLVLAFASVFVLAVCAAGPDELEPSECEDEIATESPDGHDGLCAEHQTPESCGAARGCRWSDGVCEPVGDIADERSNTAPQNGPDDRQRPCPPHQSTPDG